MSDYKSGWIAGADYMREAIIEVIRDWGTEADDEFITYDTLADRLDGHKID